MITARRLLSTAIGMYAIAWFVPVTKDDVGLAQGQVPGWDALRFALSPLWDHGVAKNGILATIMVVSGLTNALFLGVVLRTVLGKTPSRAVRWSLALAALVNACWALLFGMAFDLRVGYYLWWCSFPLLAWSLAAGLIPSGAPRSDRSR